MGWLFLGLVAAMFTVAVRLGSRGDGRPKPGRGLDGAQLGCFIVFIVLVVIGVLIIRAHR